MTDVPIGGKPAETLEPTLERVMGPWLLLLFIIGDILGTGIYALTGQVAKQVGGVVWLPFLVAFVVAVMTAFSYLELVTQVSAGRRRRALHPQGVRHSLRDIHRRVRGDLLGHYLGFHRLACLRRQPFAERSSLNFADGIGITVIGAGLHGGWSRLINFRGVGESVKFNVVLTLVELSRPADHHHDRPVGDRRRAGATYPVSRRSKRWRRGRRVLAGDRRHHACLLRHGGLRGLGQHGGGDAKDPTHIFPKVLLTGLVDHRA